MKRPLAYITAPWSNSQYENAENAAAYCRQVYDAGYSPICPHIEFVMECLRNNTTEIRNMKQYLLAVLFNAPTTISNHYTAQVNHDMYAGGW